MAKSKSPLDHMHKTRRGYILTKENDPESIIADPISKGMLLYSDYEEAKIWAQEIANEMGFVIVVEPIDLLWVSKEEESIN